MAETSKVRHDIPSIKLQITAKDGERFLEASAALKSRLSTISNEKDLPLHEQLYSAAQDCEHPLVKQFLERTSVLNDTERKGATLLFHESDKSTKLRNLFSLYNEQLDLMQVTSLFRTVLSAISACLDHQPPNTNNTNDNVIVEGKPNDDRPAKRMKLNNGDSAARDHLQSPSFDSSLATLKDEEDVNPVRKEIEEVAAFAATELIRYASNEGDDKESVKENSDGVAVDFANFGSWYNGPGGKLLPWIELLQPTKWKAQPKQQEDDSSPGSLLTEQEESRTLVSFDFNGSGCPTPLLINITEENLFALKDLVQRTNLMNRTAADVCKILLTASSHRTANGRELVLLRKDDFYRLIRGSLIPDYIYDQLTREEKESYKEALLDVFSCFEEAKSVLHEGEVDLKEFAVGFCFFCSGNKSTKLATGYELLDSKHRGYLTEDLLLRYVQSYLTMLVAMSLFVPITKRNRRKQLSYEKKKTMRQAIESGAKWTLGHFLKASGQTKNEYTFESFASWYSSGGYNVAPWLELLDLSKVLSLINDPDSPLQLPPLETAAPPSEPKQPRVRDRVSSLRRHHLTRRGFTPEVLFTFPLGNRRSLVVLKDDAAYVRAVVEQLGILEMKPDDLWISLFRAVEKRRRPAHHNEVAIYVSIDLFVQSMLEVCPLSHRKRTSASNEELLANFYQCFDIHQCNSVALDELMGGLTLLCGGKKSQKLAFAFSIFDTRPGIQAMVAKKRGIVHSLSGEDLFLFLRSILIVTFSTCRQSLDLTDDMVGRCIADTANMICNDVMRHQWETKRIDRIDFDEFGQWYNDGGFERAPWLELLDLRKWVLVDSFEVADKHASQRPPDPVQPPPLPHNDSIPPPPPGDDLDLFGADGMMQLDSMDEMDMILMQPSHDREDFAKLSKSFSQSPRALLPTPRSTERKGLPLKFQLITSEHHGGYMLSLSPSRIRHFRKLLESSGVNEVSSENACNKILSKSSHNVLNKKAFDSALKSLIPSYKMERNIDSVLLDVFDSVFAAFDLSGSGEANVYEIACGFTVFCIGKKSDKLEFAFEVLDKNKRGRLSKSDMASYLQSFLTVLLSIAFSSSLDTDLNDDSITTLNGMRCDRDISTLQQAAKAGAEWAASQAFRDFDRSHKHANSMTFDDFAAWYTSVGFGNIPWLELLDLHKWVTKENK